MISGIILSAGRSSRVNGFPKANLQFKGRTFLQIIHENMIQTGVDEIIVVLGYHVGEIADRHPEYNTVINKDFDRGPLSSINVGLEALPKNSDAVLIAHVDMPLVRQETYAKILTSYNEHSGSIFLPTIDGKRGHPVLFTSDLYPEIQAALIDIGLRSVVRNNFDKVIEVATVDKGILHNINTEEDIVRYGVSK